MLAPGGDDDMGPKGLVGGGQCRQIEGGKFVLELGGCRWVQKGLHVFVAEQCVHHGVGSCAADGFLGAGDVEIERLEEVGGVLNGRVFYGFGFRVLLLTGDGYKMVGVLHPLTWDKQDVFKEERGIRDRRGLSRSKPTQPEPRGQTRAHRVSWLHGMHESVQL